MRNFVLYFFLAMFFILIMVILGRFSVEYLGALCVNQRYDSAVTYAGWSGFQYCDLERYATRKNLANREYRYIYLQDNSEMRKAITDKMIENLKLNADMSPKDDSFLEDAVEIVGINIYNPDSLPAVINGREYNVTTIEIVTRIQVILPFGEKKTYTKRTIVNADTFLMRAQKE
ncbi:MAG: hypothetical protein JXR88_03595 [Clostridia bacterium]|nr:hypothetical protein [Clostridia bacterium]